MTPVSRTTLPIPEPPPTGPTPVDAREASYAPLEPLRPPAGAPNVLIVLIDDMGFGATSAFGGPCDMPVAERLAAGGLRYTRMHTTALCSPTRQALLTGRNHHSVNMGGIVEVATAVPGYTSIRPDSAAPLAQTLRMNGYSTAAFGKWHQTPAWETSVSGPFDRWPTGDGFEHFYGFIAAETNQWAPTLVEGTTPVEPPDDPDYHLSADLADRTIGFVRQQQAMTPDKPFFAYLAFGATHAPHHAPAEWIERYRGRFDDGYDAQRERTFARQQALGVVPGDCRLTPRPDDIPSWEDLSDDQRTVSARLMEAYAGFASHTDHQVGRVVDALAEMDLLDDTLIFYVLGDNGASGEAGVEGSFNSNAMNNQIPMSAEDILPGLDQIGGPYASNYYPAGWAHAMNTPYQWTKIIASHYGGTRTGTVVHWPAAIADGGGARAQWHHVIDIAPTVLEAAGIPHPVSVNGVQQQPIEGTSMLGTFADADAPERRTTQYFEIAGNRAIYHDGWVACTKHSGPWAVAGEELPAFTDDVWELYAPDDWSQAEDLARENPERLRRLQDQFVIEAAKYHVFPLDDRKYERLNPDIAGRPQLVGDRTSVTLWPGMSHLNENTVPNVKNKSFAVEASLTAPEGGGEGAIIAQGGRFGGWCVYLSGGVPVYCHNWVGLEHHVVRAGAPLEPGEHVLRFEFAYDGGGVGQGGTGRLLLDGEPVGEGRIERTVPLMFSYDDPTDIGLDSGAPVVEDYATPQGRCTAAIAWVRIEVGEDAHDDPEARTRAVMARH